MKDDTIVEFIRKSNHKMINTRKKKKGIKGSKKVRKRSNRETRMRKRSMERNEDE